MRKTDKKMDNQLRITLTDACETALKTIHGFQWLTHIVNYSNFPKSLQVVCVFDSNENLTSFLSNSGKNAIASIIQEKLQAIDIKVKNVTDHILYDTEERCAQDHNGNWAERLAKH